MTSGFESECTRILAGAELWARLGPVGSAAAAAPAEPGFVLVAGWEESSPGCVASIAGDDGAACRGCPVGIVAETLRTGRAATAVCASGVRLLAFPAPAWQRRSAAVLRLGDTDGRGDTDAAARPSGAAILRAARRLRTPDGLAAWQADQRTRGAERRRTAAAALAQLIATTEEFHRLYTTADRDRASSEQTAVRLDSLARETLREAEESRTRVAHALHDTAAQSMVSAHRFLQAARASLDGAKPEMAPRHLDAAQERLHTAIREVRAVLNTLVPPGLEELGLAEALRIHVRDGVPAPTRVEVTGELPRAERWLEAGLFAMTVEAISNAVLHAAAATIAIDLRETRGRSIITVTDDGSGFDSAAAGRRTEEGAGLIGMTRRASWLGGRVDVTSRPGAGTTIRISVPLARPDAAADEDTRAASAGREKA